MFKVLQLSTGYSDGSLERAAIEAAGGSLTLSAGTTEDEIITAGQDADGLLVTLANITRRVILSMPNLKIIVRAGIGVDNIDIQAAKERGIRVCNLPHYCQDEVADHTMALFLAVERKLTIMSGDVKKGEWRAMKAYAPIRGLRGRTAGFIGCGGIAQKVVSRIQPFGLHSIAFDPFLNAQTATKFGIDMVSLDDLLIKADYIFLHAPLVDDTYHILGERAFSNMKPDVYIINTSRGQLIDNSALKKALDEKKIAGAALDVVEDDLAGAKIFETYDNVVITPHAAYYSIISSEKMKADAGEAFAKFILREPLAGVIV